MSRKQSPISVKSQHLADLSGTISHGFFTRIGGVSTGDYTSLNVGLGSNDDRAAIAENRARICQSMGVEADRLAAPWQYHSAEVVIVENPWAADERPKADAIVTKEKGLAIGILTADCGPVLFADKDAGIIAAAHAGWKGALSGVIENTVATMVSLGATRSNIRAALGPSITQPNYEVGPEFIEQFCAADPNHSKYFAPSTRDTHHQFDLTGFVVDQMIATGINGHFTGHCTYALEEQFFSYRRATHRAENSYGRQISVIVRH